MSDSSTLTLDLPCGPITARHEGGLLYARGIPYAKASRFEKPTPVTWTSARDCTGPAAICPQFPSRLSIVNGDIDAGRTHSEDCFRVTVAAPAHGKGLPVMVYFHGGAYLTGAGDLDAYNPCDLARKDVVAVTVTNRLGHFGYLPIPGIAPANLGLFDHIEALKWVQTNIASFGGDPDRVTIFGQSAGADTTFCLLICELAKGLFSRAIIQSAPMGRFDEPEESRTDMIKAMGEHAYSVISSADGPLSTQQYLDLQPVLLGIAKRVYPTIVAFAPILGQDPLPPPSQVKERIQEAAKRIPVFIGWTKDEGSAFASLAHTHDTDWHTKMMFTDGSNRLHREILEATGKAPKYEVVWHPQGSKWGAAHCIELPFLLGGARGWPSAPMLEGCDVEEIVGRLGPQVKNLWVAFANGSDLGGKEFVIDDDFVFKTE